MDDERGDRREVHRREGDRVLELRVLNLEETLRIVAPVMVQVALLQAGIDDLKEWVKHDREEREKLTARVDQWENEARSGRRAILISVIAATATIIAALVGGYVTLKASGASPVR